MNEFFSKFGGLWIDSTDPAFVAAKLAGISGPKLRNHVDEFIRDGYTILASAVDSWAIDAYLREYEAAAQAADLLQMELPYIGHHSFSRELSRRPGAKVLDTGMILPAGARLCFAPRMARFLEAVFDEKSLAFQTLHFEVGSTQAMHQDTAYVVVEEQPMQLIASWLALEDVEPGAGELIYYVGGHRIAEFCYSGEFKHWNSERDGDEQHRAHLAHIRDEAERRGLELAHFLPKKGDVLFWHADLPHGGSDIERPELTRRSLVTHYCPRTRDPHHFLFIPEERRRKVETRGDNAFASFHFPPDIVAAAQNRYRRAAATE